jgi:hypothetical protein
MRRGLIALLALLLPLAPAAARPTIVSPSPNALSVTVYRDPYRGGDQAMELEWLAGYALVTETRTVSLPAGESEIRFEGVAGGIMPASAIVRGLPGGVGEKNRDARLLSAGSLIEAALGRRVHVRRTNPVTGAVTESEAIVRSGPAGVILQSAQGIEALRCTGLPETPVYEELPPGLSARPTLAVNTSSPIATTVTLGLSYLATGFDWQADYVVEVAPDGRTLDLFAWLTLANGNDESFPDANAQAVAGRPNRKDQDEGPVPVSSGIELKCWPQLKTSDIAEVATPASGYMAGLQEIRLQGTTRTEDLINSLPQAFAGNGGALQEELGDLKLYRLPEPVTVAAHSQKQIALLHRSAVGFERLYTASVDLGAEDDARPASILLRTRNVAASGLGLPLPQGRLAVFQQGHGRPVLMGESSMVDTAIGEDLEIIAGDSQNVQVSQRSVSERKKPGAADDNEDAWTHRSYEIAITNAGSSPATVETYLSLERGLKLGKIEGRTRIKDGVRLWAARVPAHGRAVLIYEVLPGSPSKYLGDDGDD